MTLLGNMGDWFDAFGETLQAAHKWQDAAPATGGYVFALRRSRVPVLPSVRVVAVGMLSSPGIPVRTGHLEGRASASLT